MTCSICGPIGDSASANTGRDVRFGPPVTSLVKHQIDARGDLWECPECEALFVWDEYTAQTGSGNNDEETITRVPAEHAAVVHPFLDRGARPAEKVAEDAGRLSSLPPVVRDLLVAHLLGRDRELAAKLVPWMLDVMDRPGHAWANEFVKKLASTIELAHLVAAEASRRPPTPALDKLRAYCKQQVCSTCRSISTYPGMKARRDQPLPPPLDALVQLGASAEEDVWECGECEAIFAWESKDGVEGSVRRTHEPLASALRACIHRSGVVPDADINMVFDAASSKVVLSHGLRRDRELVRQLVPRAIRSIGQFADVLLCDFLRRFVDGEPSDAKVVLDAIAKSSRSNRALEELASRCREVLG